jgi:hypothetical protein
MWRECLVPAHCLPRRITNDAAALNEMTYSVQLLSKAIDG